MTGPAATERKLVVHVTGDHPDSIDDRKTRVIESLVGLVADRFDQQVFSINRRSPGLRMLRHPLRPGLKVDVVAGGPLTTLRYYAPARGMYHATMLKLLGDWLARRLQRDGVPAVLVGHKLTIEGIIVARAARRLGIPYAISIQGNTDRRILSARRDLWPLFRQVYHDAAMVFPFTPWAQRFVGERLGERSGPSMLLPCPTTADTLIVPQVSGDGVVSAFHLHNYRGKNAPALIAAATLARRQLPGFRLAIVGGGTTAQTKRVAQLAQASPAVALEDPLPHADMPARIHRAAGFALPSRSDTFGLVFTEALFAGTPILYPAGTAVDGYFDGQPFAIRVDAADRRSIADGLVRLVRDEGVLKAALARWQADGGAAPFRRPAIARTFGDGLASAIGYVEPA